MKAASPMATGTIGTPSQSSRSVTATGKNQLIPQHATPTGPEPQPKRLRTLPKPSHPGGR